MADSDRKAAVDKAGRKKQKTVPKSGDAVLPEDPEKQPEKRVIRRDGDGKREKAARSSGRTKRAASGKRKRSQKISARRQSIAASFGHAYEGILTGVLEERNMKIHCVMAGLVVFFGLLLHITAAEWCVCFVLFGLIMGLELVNTAIEAVVDLVTKEYHPLAKRAKDTAAGAVLIASVMAAVTGLIIFIPRLLFFFHNLF